MYVGVTTNLERRILEHKEKRLEGFTRKYNVSKLVYFESFTDIKVAIQREKQIKGWTRKRKNKLVETMNPDWEEFTIW